MSSELFKAYRIGLCMLALLAGPAAAEQLTDPTRPPVASSPQPAARPAAGRLVLQSVIYGADRRLALINGHWVGEGELIGGARVVSIEPVRVRLRRNGRMINISMTTSSVRKQPSSSHRNDNG